MLQQLKSLMCVSVISVFASQTLHAQLFSSPPPAPAAAETPAAKPVRKKVRRAVYTPPAAVVTAPVILPTAFKFDASLEEIFLTVRQKSQAIIELSQKNNDHLLFKIGADFELYLANWEYNHASLMKSDAKSAPPAIQKFLAESDAFLLKVANNVAPIDDLLHQHDELLAKIPAVKHLPQIFSYSPYLIQPLSQKKILISIKTLSFTYGRPKLTLDGKTYDPLSEIGGLWLFEVDTSGLASKANEAGIVKAEIEVSKPKDNSTEIESYKLSLNLMVLPAQSGRYTLDYTILETVPRSEIKSITFNHTSKAVENECKDFVQATAAGRVIKNVSEIYQAGEQGSSQLLKTTPSEFTVKLCAKRQNKPQQAFPQGVQNSIWQWEEHWFDYVEKSINLEGVIPPAPEDLTIETNVTKLQKFNLVVKGNDKREYSFNGSVEKGLFSVKFNPATKVISLYPKTHEPRLN